MMASTVVKIPAEEIEKERKIERTLSPKNTKVEYIDIPIDGQTTYTKFHWHRFGSRINTVSH